MKYGDRELYTQDYAIHAILLRCENLTYKEISKRMGITISNVRKLLHIGSKHLQRATLKTRWVKYV